MKPSAVQTLVTLVLFTALASCDDELEFNAKQGTQGVELACFVNNVESPSFTRLDNMVLSEQSSGSKKVLASVSSYIGHEEPISHVSNAEVSGSVSSSEEHRGSLRILWVNPDYSGNDKYVCDAYGQDPNFLPLTISKIVKVTKSANAATRAELSATTRTELSAVLRAATRAPETQVTASTNALPTKCEDIKLGTGNHVVTLQPTDNLGPIKVLCEVKGPGDIWTVFQKRFNGSVDFYRNFHDYVHGFGSPDGEVWLGLENLRRLLVQNDNKNLIGFDLKELLSSTRYNLTYKNFYLGPADGYQLFINDELNDDGYGMSYHVFQTFSTYDHGLTEIAGPDNRAAGFWFDPSGGYVNINSKWGLSATVTSMFWYQFRRSWNYPMSETTMKFQKMK